MIDSILMEQFNVKVPYISNDPHDYFPTYEESYNEVITMLNEATQEPVKKKNVFQRIWEWIKKAFAWVAKQWKRFVAWITGNKKTKTADQCLEDASKGKAKTTNPDGQVSTSNAGAPGVKGSKQKTVTVDFKPSSTAKRTPPDLSPTQIKLQVKNIRIAMENDKITMTFNRVFADKEFFLRGGEVPNAIGNLFNSPAAIFATASNDQLMTRLQGIITAFSNDEFMHDRDVDNKLWEELKAFMKKLGLECKALNKEYEMTFAQIEEFNQILDTMNKTLARYDMAYFNDTNYNGHFDQWPNAITEFSKLAALFEEGMLAITDAINNTYNIDAAYVESVDDVEVLACFVKNMLECHIPAKYIAWNVYAVASKNLRGDADRYRPYVLHDNNRLELHPSNGSDYIRIALDSRARFLNKNESRISNALDKAGENSAPLLKVTKSYYTDAVNTTSRYEAIQPFHDTNIKIAEFDQQKYEIEEDLNGLMGVKDANTKVGVDALGKIGSNVVATEYGRTHRMLNPEGAVNEVLYNKNHPDSN